MRISNLRVEWSGVRKANEGEFSGGLSLVVRLGKIETIK